MAMAVDTWRERAHGKMVICSRGPCNADTIAGTARGQSTRARWYSRDAWMLLHQSMPRLSITPSCSEDELQRCPYGYNALSVPRALAARGEGVWGGGTAGLTTRANNEGVENKWLAVPPVYALRRPRDRGALR
eukprot:849751-Prorocentrum_minimum.AAC.1